MKIRLKPAQATVFLSEARFRILVAGRRFGKSYLSMVELCRGGWGKGRIAWYVAPNYRQAKRICWRALKEMTRPYWASTPSETDLRIDLASGGMICLRGADNYHALRGEGIDFLVLDEFADFDGRAWTEVLRPALADREGKALFIGTPRGFNHFYEMFKDADNKPDWESFQYTTEQGGNVTSQELSSAARDLDPRAYQQEFQARFENLASGRVYPMFDRVGNVHPQRYDPLLPLCWALDFNINPMCSVLAQINGDRLHVLDELVLPDTRTPEACEAFEQRTREWLSSSRLPISLRVYGDSTASRRQTCATHSDWQIVTEFFNRHTDRFRVSFHRRSNPEVKDRVAAVNALLLNHAGERRLRIDPRCKELIEDFEQVTWASDPHGNLLLKLDDSSPKRTHASDAIGYLIDHEFGLRARGGERPGNIR